MRLGALIALVPLCLTCSLSRSHAQANGKLQLHFIDVGQGDAALLISPQGQVVLFDDGVLNQCGRPIDYLQQLGILQIDYHIASHYHADHIGCAPAVFARFPLAIAAIDRGSSYASATYNNYVAAAGSFRTTAWPGMEIVLDGDTTNPVRIVITALNGNGLTTSDENSLSIEAEIRFGNFDVSMGGDLVGSSGGGGRDIETSVAPLVGQVEVYKGHHHCSTYSTNSNWVAGVGPAVAVCSVGDGNPYHHPHPAAIARLHDAGVKTFWTETGSGATPDPAYDQVVGSFVVEAAPGADTFTVTHGNVIETFPMWGVGAMFSYNTQATDYHYSTCSSVGAIAPENLVQQNVAPEGRRLHPGCPAN